MSKQQEKLLRDFKEKANQYYRLATLEKNLAKKSGLLQKYVEARKSYQLQIELSAAA